MDRKKKNGRRRETKPYQGRRGGTSASSTPPWPPPRHGWRRLRRRQLGRIKHKTRASAWRRKHRKKTRKTAHGVPVHCRLGGGDVAQAGAGGPEAASPWARAAAMAATAAGSRNSVRARAMATVSRRAAGTGAPQTASKHASSASRRPAMSSWAASGPSQSCSGLTLVEMAGVCVRPLALPARSRVGAPAAERLTAAA